MKNEENVDVTAETTETVKTAVEVGFPADAEFDDVLIVLKGHVIYKVEKESVAKVQELLKNQEIKIKRV